MPNVAAFSYMPLGIARPKFRLLRLQPDFTDSEAVHCIIRHHKIRKCPPYIALSYTWGPPEPTREILVNGLTFRVRENLYQFLKTAVTLIGPQWLWIDQLCIDQSNIIERNSQVLRMASIYQKAKSVIVWLGQGDEHSTQAMQIIRDHETQSSVVLPASSLTSISSFFDRPYWKRLWIVQELIFAKDITLICGDQSMPWSTLDNFYQHEPSWELRNAIGKINGIENESDARQIPPCIFKEFSKYSNIYSKNTLEPSSIGYLISSRLHHSGRAHYSLLAALTAFSGSECQDPRDKIYGLLGIVVPEHRILVDYSKNAAQVFADTVQRLVDLAPDMESALFNIVVGRRPVTIEDTCLQIGRLGRSMGLLKTDEEFDVLSQYVTWRTLENLSSLEAESITRRLTQQLGDNWYDVLGRPGS